MAPSASAVNGISAGVERTADNVWVADMLRRAAALLAAQQANPFRVAAYRKAAETVASLSTNVRELFEREGRDGLDALPSIGPGIAGAIGEMLVTGRWGQLDRLRGEVDPARVFQSVPGIGTELSRRIHDELGIDTLEALEAAAHDGRLERMQGFGTRRASSIRAVLGQMLDRGRARGSARAAQPARGEPAVDMLLDVDREYRDKARSGALAMIAPRRFNPRGEAWLPVLHAQRGPWHFTALYSNTAQAHRLQREHDWVILYFHDGDHLERQHTVVTETRGPLQGLRVVRGREAECRAAHEASRRTLEPAVDEAGS
jgi:hypothetical protein